MEYLRYEKATLCRTVCINEMLCLGGRRQPKSANVEPRNAVASPFNIPTIYKIYMLYILEICLVYIWVSVKRPKKTAGASLGDHRDF